MTYANHVGKWHDLSNAKFHVLMGIIARFIGLMLIVTAAPAGAATVSAHYFAFEPEKHFFDGGDDTSSTRSRAVVDSGFVHVPIFNKGDWVYQAKAAAALTTGTLRIFAFSDTSDFHLPEAPPSLLGGYESLPSASFLDVVSFAAPVGAPGGAAVPVTVKLDVSGRFAGFFSNMENKTSLQIFTPGSLQKSQVEFIWSGREGPDGTPNPTATALGTVTNLAVIEPSQLHALLSVTVMAIPGNPISISAAMAATADAGIFASGLVGFDHTATLSIEAPPGFTFTSSSGVLLTAPVPVPAAVWMLGPGLVGLWRMRRRLPSSRRAKFHGSRRSRACARLLDPVRRRRIGRIEGARVDAQVNRGPRQARAAIEL